MVDAGEHDGKKREKKKGGLWSRCNGLSVRCSQLTDGALLFIYHSAPEAKHNPCILLLSRSQMRNVFEYLNTEDVNCVAYMNFKLDLTLICWMMLLMIQQHDCYSTTGNNYNHSQLVVLVTGVGHNGNNN